MHIFHKLFFYSYKSINKIVMLMIYFNIISDWAGAYKSQLSWDISSPIK